MNSWQRLHLRLSPSGRRPRRPPRPGGLTEPGYKTPHTSWGVPDLQGFWSNTSFTGMQRPAGATKLVLSEEEAAALARRNI